jgi:AhpC/TSA family
VKATAGIVLSHGLERPSNARYVSVLKDGSMTIQTEAAPAKRRIFSARRISILAAFLGAAVALVYFGSPYISAIGAPAPVAQIGGIVDASIAGSDGSAHKLSEFRGKIVVLEWTNPLCEFTSPRYASGAMQAMQREAIAAGVVWIPVSSTFEGGPGYMDVAQAEALRAERKFEAPYIALDASGEVGRQFGAYATPSAAIIDASGKFAYAGAIDDNPWGDGTAGNNYVKAAIADLQAGKPVATPQTRAYGCGIKYGS